MSTATVKRSGSVHTPSDTRGEPEVPRRGLAHRLVDAVTERIHSGALGADEQLPTEQALMQGFGVSRTVVREALSRLQAAGLVETRHGIGTFVCRAGHEAQVLRVSAEQLATTREVIALLELRIGIETEAAGLAALRRDKANLAAMRRALDQFTRAIADDGDALAPDFDLHMEIARATQNVHFVELMTYLGTRIIPRARVNTVRLAGSNHGQYLQRVHADHGSIVDAITARDAPLARTAMHEHLSASRERLLRAEQAAARGPLRSGVKP